MTQSREWHIFCRVVDNFGDIGVCWRLARQLAAEHGKAVCLWLDDPASLRRLCPDLDLRLTDQRLAGVRVRHWAEPFPSLAPEQVGELVIEAFACELPASYIQAMRARKPLWLNLEYLSAESWVRDCHLAPSPVYGLTKVFFFPGFEAGTGGLLCDRALGQADAEMAAPGARAALFARLGLAPALADRPLQVSLFSYENPALPGLLDALASHAEPCHLLLPEGRIGAEVSAWLGQPLAPGQTRARGALALSGLPFLSQPDYDRLLASCQLNGVRGEESFARAQMLGRPLLWHIYRQAADAHLVKLTAWLDRYLAGWPTPLAGAVQSAQLAWNQAGQADWRALLAALPAWQSQAEKWRARLNSLGDLASNIVQFSTNRL